MANEPLSPDTVEALAATYGLQIARQELPESGPSMKSNAVVLVTRLGNRFVAQPYDPEQFSAGMVRFQNQASEYIRRQGIITPRVLENDHMDTVTVLPDERIFTMQDFVEGTPLDPKNPEHAQAALATLGTMNLAFTRFTDREGYAPLRRFSRPLPEQFDELAEALPATPQDGIGEYMAAVQPRMRQYALLVEEQKAGLSYERTLIHGNFTPHAAIIDPEGKVHVTGFDFLREDPRGVDVAHTLDLLCFEKEEDDIITLQRVDHRKLREGFRAYRARDPSIVDQISDMPLLLAHYGLNSLIATWRGRTPNATPREQEYCDRRYAFFVRRVDIALEAGEDIVRTLREA
jgi:hypothetical protein